MEIKDFTLKEVQPNALTGQYDVVVTGETLKKIREKAEDKQIEKASVKGFRKGKIPREVALKSANADAITMDIYHEVFDMVMDHLQKNFKELKLKPLAFHDIIVPVKEIIDNNNACHMIVEFSVIPKIDLSNWTDKVIEVSKIEVSDEEVEAKIRELLEQKAEIEIIKETRELTNGDIANIDFVGSYNGKEFQGGSSKNYDLKIGSHTFIDNFEEQLIGMKKGEQRHITVHFPGNYHNRELVNQDVNFDVTLNEIKIQKNPEINEEWVKSLNYPNVENENTLKSYLQPIIIKEKEQKQLQHAEEEILQTLLQSYKAEIPPRILSREIQNMEKNIEKQLKDHELTLESYLQKTGASLDGFKKQLEEECLQKLRIAILLEQIAEYENISLEEADFNHYWELMSKDQAKPIEEIKEKFPKSNELEFRLRNDKTWLHIKSKLLKHV